MTTILSLVTLLAAPASAASHELSVELGSLGTRDERFELFHERNLLGTFGLRGAVAVHPRVAIVGGWHYATAGNAVESESFYADEDYEYYEDYYEQGAFQAAYRGHHLLVGPKVDFPVDTWGFPYLTVQGGLFIGQVLLDEDRDDDENINQLKATAFAPGGVAAVGVDIVPLRLPSAQVGFGGHLEAGYAASLDTSYKGELPTGTGLTEAELARFGLGGLYLRAGIGVYF